MDQKSQNNTSTFYGLGIAPAMIELLERLKFTIPTPIQLKAIPIAIEGKDVIGVAQTGTGKTLAFGVPMIQRLLQKPGNALVLVPTRELAIQVEEVIVKIGQPFNIRAAVIIGGASIFNQIKALRMNPRVIIATPGRLLDHLRNEKVNLKHIHTIVLDEADRMLDMGFAPQINDILKHVPSERQTMLFSATIPDKILKIASTYMKLPVSIEVAPSGTTVENVIQELYIIRRDDKSVLLLKFLDQYRGTVLIFCRTKRGASHIVRGLREHNFSAAEIHSNRSLAQRREALEGFKNGRYRILVATDIASRGIDVKGIELVINYDLPDDAENYVHRIGRTARAGHSGRAISFATPDQKGLIRSIESVMRNTLPVAKHPDIVPSEFFGSDVKINPAPHLYRRGQSRRDQYKRGYRR